MAGKFELCNDAMGKFRFRQKASNGEIIAVGEAYEVESQRERASSRCRRTRPGATC